MESRALINKTISGFSNPSYCIEARFSELEREMNECFDKTLQKPFEERVAALHEMYPMMTTVVKEIYGKVLILILGDMKATFTALYSITYASLAFNDKSSSETPNPEEFQNRYAPQVAALVASLWDLLTTAPPHVDLAVQRTWEWLSKIHKADHQLAEALEQLAAEKQALNACVLAILQQISEWDLAEGAVQLSDSVTEYSVLVQDWTCRYNDCGPPNKNSSRWPIPSRLSFHSTTNLERTRWNFLKVKSAYEAVETASGLAVRGMQKCLQEPEDFCVATLLSDDDKKISEAFEKFKKKSFSERCHDIQKIYSSLPSERHKLLYDGIVLNLRRVSYTTVNAKRDLGFHKEIHRSILWALLASISRWNIDIF